MTGNVLVVDDESGALKLLKDILESEGYLVRPFNNGELALRSIKAEAPELVLLDIRMPGMSGFDVCQQIKTDKTLENIPVIFISAATDMEDKVKAFQAGGVDYITKPFQKEEVIARVKTHIALSDAIHRLKNIAEALRVSEESLRMAQAVAHVGYWEWDMKSNQFICSEEMCRILGLEGHASRMEKEVFFESIHPDDRESVVTHLRDIMAGQGIDIEYRVVLPDGEVRVVHGQGRKVLSKKGQEKFIGTVQDIDDQEKMLGVIQDITERKELERKLEELANTDYLTGCDSRRHFLEHAEQELLRVRRYGGQMSMLMLDLDHFKSINDKYGHQVGDVALKKLVQVCKNLMREVDVVGRLGGEEFAILLVETGSEWAQEVAGRLCQAVALAEVPLEDASSIHFTTSIGVASMTADDHHIDTIIGRADKALYKAKHTGRNRVCTEV